MSYWRCEDSHTDLKIDYKYNQHSMARFVVKDKKCKYV